MCALVLILVYLYVLFGPIFPQVIVRFLKESFYHVFYGDSETQFGRVSEDDVGISEFNINGLIITKFARKSPDHPI